MNENEIVKNEEEVTMEPTTVEENSGSGAGLLMLLGGVCALGIVAAAKGVVKLRDLYRAKKEALAAEEDSKVIDLNSDDVHEVDDD